MRAVRIMCIGALLLGMFANFAYAFEQLAQPSLDEVMAEFEHALQKAIAASKTADDYNRSKALRSVAEAAFDAGLIERALEVIREIPHGSEAAGAIRYGADLFAKEPKILEQLIGAAKGIRDKFYSERALGYIAASLANAGLFEQAAEIAKGIKESYVRSLTLSSICVAMAKSGHKLADSAVKEAFEAAKKVGGEISVEGAVAIDRRSMALMNFSRSASESGFFNYAVEAVKETENEEFKSWGICYTATWIARLGKREYKPFIDQLLAMSKDISEPRSRALALSAIAGALLKIGEQNEANALLEQAIKAAGEETNPLRKSWIWRDIARGMALAGMYDKAIHFAKLAAFEGSTALRIICTEMLREGLYEQAIKVAREIPNIDERSEAMRSVAIAMIKDGKIEQAMGIAREMSKALRKHYPSIRMAVMVMAEAGNWGEAFQLAKSIQDAKEYLQALAHIAKAMKTAKQ